jgi:hypothetical protein
VAVDFFGRAKILTAADEAASEEREKESKQIRFIYKYHEGSSNAVKLPIKISDLCVLCRS